MVQVTLPRLLLPKLSVAALRWATPGTAAVSAVACLVSRFVLALVRRSNRTRLDVVPWCASSGLLLVLIISCVLKGDRV